MEEGGYFLLLRLRSIETLSLRMERAAESSQRVAEWLSVNDLIPCSIFHPEFCKNEDETRVYASQCTGPGSTFSFVVEDDRALAFRIINALQLFKLAVSLGGTESLVCHPASTTHSGVQKEIRNAAGVTDGLIRISIGLEHPDDLIEDLKLAFKKATGGETADPSHLSMIAG